MAFKIKTKKPVGKPTFKKPSNVGKPSFKKKPTFGNKASSGGGIRAKFKQKSNETLKRIYEDREKKVKFAGFGKSIFDQAKLAEFGISEFKPVSKKDGNSYYIEVMPISFSDAPYFHDVSIHWGVGVNNDAYLCPKRSIQFGNKNCPRCSKLSMLFKTDTWVKERDKHLYPDDRPIYFIWDRTKELLEGAEPEFNLQVWAVPKTNFHSPIAAKTRNKLTQTTIDISDLEATGKTVSFEVYQKGEWPNYMNFELNDREDAIPDEVVVQLDNLITVANENGFNNIIEMLLLEPDAEEFEKAMKSEDEMTGNVKTDKATPDGIDKEQHGSPESVSSDDDGSSMEEINQQAEAEAEELLELLGAKTDIALKLWCKSNGFEEYYTELHEDKDTLVETIAEEYFNQKVREYSGDVPY